MLELNGYKVKTYAIFYLHTHRHSHILRAIYKRFFYRITYRCFLADCYRWTFHIFTVYNDLLFGKKMRFLSGIACIAVGLGIWAISITVLIAWLAFCFGTVIIGILLLIFMPYVLLAPLAIGVPGTALLFLGMDKIANKSDNSIIN